MPFLPFVAVDVETANLNNANICQLGIAIFDQGILTHKVSTLVNPRAKFNPKFERQHGITRAHVTDAPTWEQVYPRCAKYLSNQIVLSHTLFDQEAIDKASARLGLALIEPLAWVDTCRVARSVWPELRNHKLPTLAECFGISYSAHDACDDARCAGEIFLRAISDSGLSMEQIIREHAAVDVSGSSATPIVLHSEPLDLNPQNDPMTPGQLLFCIILAIIGLISFLAN